MKKGDFMNDKMKKNNNCKKNFQSYKKKSQSSKKNNNSNLDWYYKNNFKKKNNSGNYGKNNKKNSYYKNKNNNQRKSQTKKNNEYELKKITFIETDKSLINVDKGEYQKEMVPKKSFFQIIKNKLNVLKKDKKNKKNEVETLKKAKKKNEINFAVSNIQENGNEIIYDKTLYGSRKLNLNDERSSKKSRKLIYIKEALFISLIFSIVNIIAYYLINNISIINLTNIEILNVIITFVINMIIIFLGTFIIDYIYTEFSIKDKTKKQHKEGDSYKNRWFIRRKDKENIKFKKGE